MDIQPFYHPPDKDLWQGRRDIIAMERFHQVITVKNFTECIAEPMVNPTVVFIGFASDEGVRRNQGRVGAKMGPNALRQALANYPLHGGRKKIVQLIDIGDIVCDESLDEAQKALAYVIEQVVAKGGFPIVLGGGHETAWGHYQGLTSKWEKSNLAILNFDAHFDMRPLFEGNKGTSGTSFLQIAQQRKDRELPFHYYCVGIKMSSNTQSLFATAHHWGAKYLTCDDIFEGTSVIPHFISKILSRHDAIYVSICLDVFDQCYAPGVSAPSVYGLQPWHVLKAIHQLSGSGKVVALDMVELAPNYDRDNITAKLGALCIADFIYNWPATQVEP